MVWDLARVLGLALLLMTLAVVFVGVFVGEGLVLLPLVAYVAGGGVVAALFVIASLLLGNGYDAQFAVGPAGVLYQSGSRGQSVSRVAILAGVLARSPAAAGAGLIAASREVTAIPWTDVERIQIHRGPRVISLQSKWRTLLRLHCTAENFDHVSDSVRRHVQNASEARQHIPAQSDAEASGGLARHKLLLALATWTTLTVVFAFMTRAWYWVAEDTALIVLISAAFLITAGFLGRVGWVLAIPSGALATLALVITVAVAMESSQSILDYTYDLDTGAFWLTAAGCLGLMKMSALCIVGRGPLHWARLLPPDTESSTTLTES
jgi:hypothetical protein